MHHPRVGSGACSWEWRLMGMLAYLLQGIVLGFTAGISPGPMLGLVINQTLKHGWRAGSVTALAPLLSDMPIIILMVFVLGHLPQLMLHILSLIRRYDRDGCCCLQSQPIS